MVLYSNMGKRNEALKIYERCRKALRDELDVEPDQLTVALYEKIVG
jgi:DNA-binding SARP family transcriptional activator